MTVEANTRTSWKFAAYNSVSGTPTAFLNGVQVENFPGTTSEWNKLLKNSLSADNIRFLLSE